jgi:hypothetical protein
MTSKEKAAWRAKIDTKLLAHHRKRAKPLLRTFYKEYWDVMVAADRKAVLAALLASPPELLVSIAIANVEEDVQKRKVINIGCWALRAHLPRRALPFTRGDVMLMFALVLSNLAYKDTLALPMKAASRIKGKDPELGAAWKAARGEL